MAEEKKPSSGWNDNEFNLMIFIIIGLYLLWVIIQKINSYLVQVGAGSYGDIWETLLNVFFKNVWPAIKLIAIVICVVMAWSIYNVLQKYNALKKEENHLYGIKSKKPEGEITEDIPTPTNPAWSKVQSHINSKNPSEWRLAIIEADVILDDLLKACGYHGETVGDRLRAVEKSDFSTLESAWEAHKVRNQIAHQGSSFEINEREAKRVIALYEVVFREFKII